MESKAETGLMRKTKKELVEIILRKDDVEIKLKESLKTKDEEIDSLNSKNIGYEADINGLNRMREENLNTIEELKNTLKTRRKCIRRWQVAFITLAVSIIIIIAVLA